MTILVRPNRIIMPAILLSRIFTLIFLILIFLNFIFFIFILLIIFLISIINKHAFHF